MELVNQLYTDIRKNKHHMDLGGAWSYCWSDAAVTDVGGIDWTYSTKLPKSLYWSLYESGVLPHPYKNCNSHEYGWVDTKVWYYKKDFFVSGEHNRGRALLCFDGAAYYTRLWVNGTYIGNHEGMFGGPCMDIQPYLKYDDENEIIVEICSCNFGKPFPDYAFRSKDNAAIVPWNIVKDTESSNGDFTVLGLWRGVRIEFLTPEHLARPQLVTKEVENGVARLHLGVEILQEELPEAFYPKEYEGPLAYSFGYKNGISGKTKDRKLKVETRVLSPDGSVAYRHSEGVELTDYKEEAYLKELRESDFYELDITINDPKLWNPVGLGDPNLYTVEIRLYQSDMEIDALTLQTGIRIFELKPTSGKKHRTRWDDFRFYVNGRDFFAKGVNWMPVDFLYLEKEETYRWMLEMVKDAGIQLIRVWSGGGYPESDIFYKLCDELGILVWQDNFIANMDTPNWRQDILQEQVCLNLYRIRNHPSLVIHCGGNEFNPYSIGNASSMFVIQRNIQDLDGSKAYVRTTPDKGSAHVYRDMEPTWYRHSYKELPFVAETGIHSFPNARSLKKLISREEYTRKIDNMLDESFKDTNPDLLNHFTEYVPSRVPRMLSRASAISDVSKAAVEELAVATQTASAEFYQILIQSLRENYPVTGGVMLWVLKRSWTTVGIQLVDGAGEPIIPYYYVKNAYSPLNVDVRFDDLTYGVGENMRLPVSIINETGRRIEDTQLRLEVYNDHLQKEASWTYPVDVRRDAYRYDAAQEMFTLEEKHRDRFLIVRAALYKDDRLLEQSIYWPKCISKMDDEDFREQYRSEPSENITFTNGPWLRENIEQSDQKAVLSCGVVSITERMDGNSRSIKLQMRITNTSDVPAFPVVISLDDSDYILRGSDNYFFLPAREERIVTLHCKNTGDGAVESACGIEVSAWNANVNNVNI